MAEQVQPKAAGKPPVPAPRTSDAGKPTHILVSSKRPGFNRGGFRWSSEYQALPLVSFEHKARELKARGVHAQDRPDADIARELIESVLKEPMLVSRLITEREAEGYARLKTGAANGDISPAALYDVVVKQQEEIEALRKQLDGLQARMFGAAAPASADDLTSDGAPPLRR